MGTFMEGSDYDMKLTTNRIAKPLNLYVTDEARSLPHQEVFWTFKYMKMHKHEFRLEAIHLSPYHYIPKTRCVPAKLA